MSVGLGELYTEYEGKEYYYCDDSHQSILYKWDVYSGSECPLCDVIDPEEYAEQQNEDLQKAYDEMCLDYIRLKHRSKALINVMKEQEVDDEHFEDDVVDETQKENEDEY